MRGDALLPEIPGAPFLPQLILTGEVFGASIFLPQSVSKRQTQESSTGSNLDLATLWSVGAASRITWELVGDEAFQAPPSPTEPESALTKMNDSHTYGASLSVQVKIRMVVNLEGCVDSNWKR